MTNQRGFTLIELLIVVVIVGVLAAVAIPKFANTKSKAYVTAMKSDLRNIMAAQLDYFASKGTYTDDPALLNVKQSAGVSAPVIALGTRAYSVTVTHAQLPGVSCAIAHSVPNPLDAAAANGEPVCK